MPKVEVENVIRPGNTRKVDAAKYQAVRNAYLRILPATSPGFTPAEILARLMPLLANDLFPGGATAGWWAKTVQLDLEAKGLAVRTANPVRLRRITPA